MNYPKRFEKLIESFQRLPGIGYKSAERMAHHMLDMKEEYLDFFSSSINNIKELKRCAFCNNISDEKYCVICKDESRNRKTVCVIQNIKDLFAIEKSSSYNGLYFVLNKVISPSKGVLPDDLNIDVLLKQIKKFDEVILATNPTIEGETTALFIQNMLDEEDVNISRLAYGLPMGGNLEYTDEVTISKSFENRKILEKEKKED